MAFAAVIVALAAVEAHAASERLAVSQQPDSTITVTLTGTDDCSGAPNVLPPTSVSVAGTSVSIASPLGPSLPVICPPGSPVFPYSISTNLGVLANADYTATWSFVPPAMPAASIQFSIVGGLLVPPASVPSLSPLAEAIMAALLLGFALFALRDRSRRRDERALYGTHS